MLNASLEESQLKIIEREGQCPLLQLEVHMKWPTAAVGHSETVPRRSWSTGCALMHLPCIQLHGHPPPSCHAELCTDPLHFKIVDTTCSKFSLGCALIHSHSSQSTLPQVVKSEQVF